MQAFWMVCLIAFLFVWGLVTAVAWWDISQDTVDATNACEAQGGVYVVAENQIDGTCTHN